MRYWGFAIFFLWMSFAVSGQDHFLRTNQGVVQFSSEAPLELIRAKSSELQGILNTQTGAFAFRVYIKSFQGFNSPLQQEHFYENYMEVNMYPEAIFQGKLIEPFESVGNEPMTFRAKGKIKIHGIENEILIPVELHHDSSGDLAFKASFEVKLQDHDIEVPKIVFQKIAQEILVEVSGKLQL